MTTAGGKIDILIDPDTRGFDSKLASGLKNATGIAGRVGKGIGLAIAAGTTVAAVGLKQVIDKGVEYERNLNELQAVSQATAVQMRQVGDTAKALGADMSLPATSAADAAAAMVELAKGRLSVEQSMKAAKGTLQLAAAAQIGAAEAAEIQSSSLNAFRLSADQAGRVADVLANTANAAAGSIVDIANSMKYVAPVSAALSVSIEHTAAAIGLLANQGIKGEQAGTSLRGILASLASPSKEAAKALDVLGVKAFDTQGKFVGLRTFTDQLAKAKKRLSDADFAAASSTAFGNEGFTAANALAAEGAVAFDEMAQSVGRAGGAADVAAAKTKGLGGAIEGFKSQVETAQIGIFEEIAPTIEKGVRKAADAVAAATPVVVSGIRSVVSAGEVFGPSLADAIRARGEVVGDAVREVLGPIASAVPGVLNAGVNAAIGLWNDFTDVLVDVVDAAKPVARGIADVARAAVEADGPLSAAGTALGLVGDVAKIAAGVLVPIGKIVGGIVSAFADLPGPVQSAVIALGVVAAFKGPLGSLGETVQSRVTAPFKRMGEEIRLQSALLTGSSSIMSAQIGRVGLAMAALESRVPVIGRMADSFRSASSAVQAMAVSNASVISNIGNFADGTSRLRDAVQSSVVGVGRLGGAIAGVGAAAGTAVKAGLGSLVGFLGGPWGVVLAGAGAGLSLLASKQQQAAREAAEHSGRVQALAGTLDQQTGAVTSATRALSVHQLAQSDVGGSARKLGLDLGLVSDASTGNADAQRRLGEQLRNSARGAVENAGKLGMLEQQAKNLGVPVNTLIDAWLGNAAALNTVGKAAENSEGRFSAIISAFDQFIPDQNRVGEAVNKTAQDLGKQRDALREANTSMLDATGTGRTLAAAMDVLAEDTATADDRARALKEALDALNGGEISLEATQARMNEQLLRLQSTFGANVDKTKGWGKALLNADGTIKTTTENGQRLFTFLGDYSAAASEAASRTRDLALRQGDDVPTAMAKARAAAQSAREEFVKQGQALGLLPDQIQAVADRYGLLPDDIVIAMKFPDMTKAQQELVLVKNLIDKVPNDKPITVRSLSDEAKARLKEIGFIVTTLPDGSVKVVAHDAEARARFNNFIESISNKTVTVKIVGKASGTGAIGLTTSGGHMFQARGGIVEAYAHGGIRDITPMRGGVADIVPPNTLRVIGDRVRDDEAYIPINREPHSLAIMEEAARRMGGKFIRLFATGGITGSSSAPITTTAGPITIENHIEVGGEVVRVVRTEIRQSNRDSRTRVLAGAGGEFA